MTGWHKAAACAGLPVDHWFTDRPDPVALKVCIGCPVRQSCLDAALHEEAGDGLGRRYGLRGGLTPAQRYRLAIAEGSAAR